MRACTKPMLMAMLAALALGSAGPAMADPDQATADSDAAILAEVNFAREHPQDYARRLMLRPVSAWEAELVSAGDTEDPGAFAEAIDFLMRQTPLPPLSGDERLEASALEHVEEQGETGDVGHDGPSGERFSDRIRRHGVSANATVAENIAYGPPSASDMVRELIIDRGVASRGHRQNFFNSRLTAAGVKCGPHKLYSTMCVIDFASSPQEPAARRQPALTSRAQDGVMFRLLAFR